jgi:hypothetical protein
LRVELKLGAMEKYEGVIAENPVGREFQVSLYVREDRGGNIETLVDFSEKHVRDGIAALGQGVQRAAFRLCEMA